jgi:hypothetical protein
MHQRRLPVCISRVQICASLRKQRNCTVVPAGAEDRRLSLIVLQVSVGSRRNE